MPVLCFRLLQGHRTDFVIIMLWLGGGCSGAVPLKRTHTFENDRRFFKVDSS